jgi:regulator of sigma E protease
MGYVATLVLIGLLILIHELGHLAAAKWAGIPVAEFAVGFGPRVWSRRRGGTEYSLRVFPLGGFVLPALTGHDELRAIPLARRLVFFLGGPLANLVPAVPLFALLNAARGAFSVDGLLVAPFAQTLAACEQFLLAVPALLGHPQSLSGVVGIVAAGGGLAGWVKLVEMAISLTLSLAILNLLPIPVLDGGQIVLGCLEQAFPRMVRLRPAATVAGLLLLGGLMLYANVHDVVRIWS